MNSEVAGSSPATPKFYIVGRKDLPLGMRAAQMFHAARHFQDEHRELEEKWFRESNTIVLLEVEDGDALAELASKARAQGVEITEFSEPDFLDVGITALALGPDASRLVASLPLAFR